MQIFLILQLLILLAVANGTPVLAKTILGDRLARPLDGGTVLVDGRPVFGPAKTIRGIVLALLATPLAAALMGLPWRLGALVAALAIAGDLFSSFVKRRLGLPSSSMAIGLDQIPESLFPLLAARLFVPVSFLDVIVGVAIFFAGEIVLSRILFHLNLRDRPY
ncbi:MAG: CDP-archaeol synthase [Methyloceanibacter sp.]|jgi:CDP-2,3-bis-(O-geranylgeranyl)-sn-glycerol synthase|nr:CDP-archaeol synthase [Methyloceanibacter sp.]